ncbi:hypothetical protein ACFSTE_05865 [Aquimarina hainanensis]|uniref:Uncharacterized protein n=1 Tax=Aquimarina hainanensis TaxID=1578017 RepID=A0ABW5N4A5_9FLAO
MPDYNQMTKEQLIEIVQHKDVTITSLYHLEQELRQNITDLEISTADKLINAVIKLPLEQQKKLPKKIRTDPIAIKAFTAFNYGGISCGNASDPDNPIDIR